jgi:beta-galactosidase/beta-glucuronidase
VSVQVVFATDLIEPAELALTVTDPQGQAGGMISRAVAAGQQGTVIETRVAQVQSWSPDEPHLYGLHACMRRDGVAIDAVRDHFGFRTIEARDGKLYLNGKPFYLRAALDQDYYPETIYSVPSVAFLEGSVSQGQGAWAQCAALSSQGA